MLIQILNKRFFIYFILLISFLFSHEVVAGESFDNYAWTEIDRNTYSHATVKYEDQIIGRFKTPISAVKLIYMNGKTVSHSFGGGEIDLKELKESIPAKSGGVLGAIKGGFFGVKCVRKFSIKNPLKILATSVGMAAVGHIINDNDNDSQDVMAILFVGDNGKEIKFANLNNGIDKIEIKDIHNAFIKNNEDENGNKNKYVGIDTAESFIVMTMISFFFLFFIFVTFFKLIFWFTISRRKKTINTLIKNYNTCIKNIDKTNKRIGKAKYKLDEVNLSEEPKKFGFLAKLIKKFSAGKSNVALNEIIQDHETVLSEFYRARDDYFEKLSKYTYDGNKRDVFRYKFVNLLIDDKSGLIKGIEEKYSEQPTKTDRASRSKRMIAFFIDSGFVFSIVFLFSQLPNSIITGEGMFWFTIFGLIVYSSVLECSPLSATIGKRIMRIYVGDTYGFKKGLFEMLYREISKYIFIFISWGVVLVFSLLCPKKPTLHDIFGRTIVLQKA